MKKKLNILSITMLALSVAFLVSCDASQDSPEDTKPAYTLTVPVTLALDNQVVFTNDSSSTTRAADVGDPGIDDKLSAPTYLYLWALAKLNTVHGTDGQYEIMYRPYTLSASDWTYTLGDTNSENKDTHYTTTMVTFSTELIAEGANVGRVYAIASNKEITSFPEALTVNENKSASDDQWTTYLNETAYNTRKTNLEAATLDLSSWTSAELRDLYSSPTACTSNGVVSFQSNNISITPLELYHCAAKVDFTWEVDAAIQNTTSVSTITVNNLPTECKLFKPTDNPTGTGTCTVLGSSGAVNTLTPGNQWIGRAYAYVLQQPVTDNVATSAKLDYTTTFAGRESITKIFAPSASADAGGTGATINTTYTGWYRINATIK